VASPRGSRSKDEPVTAVDVELAKVIAELGPDERAVILEIAKRLTIGRSCYGLLDIRNDRRDWRVESNAELLDACVYLTCASLRDRPKGEDK
jgi:hypothetical protein